MSRREQVLLIVGLLVVILLGFNYLVYQPHQTDYQALVAQKDERQARLTQMQSVAARRAQLEADYQQKQSRIATLEAKLPTEKEVPALLVQLERQTVSLNVDLTSIRPGALQAVSTGQSATPAPGGQPSGAAPPAGGAPPPGGAQPGAQAQPTYYRFPVGLSFKASYNQLVALMNAFQDFPRLIAVTRIAMSPTKVPELSATVDTETYVLPKEANK